VIEMVEDTLVDERFSVGGVSRKILR